MTIYKTLFSKVSFPQIFYNLILFFPFIFISWRLITLQYGSGFCHTLTWISHGVTCILHPDPHSHLPLHPIPLGLPSAPGPSTYTMEYYSAIKKNSFESVLMRWMKLEPIIQSEVSQKDKDQYSTLTNSLHSDFCPILLSLSTSL